MIGRTDLGLSDGEFWGLTLKLFTRLWDRHREIEKGRDRRSGEVAAMVANTLRQKKSDRYWTWLDIYPEHKAPPRPLTEEEQLAVWEKFAAGWSGGGEN